MLKEKKDELLANSYLNEETNFYDRAHFFFVAQGIFFSAFATLIVGSSSLTGYFKWIPVIVCSTGIGLNIILVKSNTVQVENILKPLGTILQPLNTELIQHAKEVLKNVNEEAKEKGMIEVVPNVETYAQFIGFGQSPRKVRVYELAPYLIFVAWGLMLLLYGVQWAFGLKIPFT